MLSRSRCKLWNSSATTPTVAYPLFSRFHVSRMQGLLCVHVRFRIFKLTVFSRWWGAKFFCFPCFVSDINLFFSSRSYLYARLLICSCYCLISLSQKSNLSCSLLPGRFFDLKEHRVTAWVCTQSRKTKLLKTRNAKRKYTKHMYIKWCYFILLSNSVTLLTILQRCHKILREKHGTFPFLVKPLNALQHCPHTR